MYRKALDHPTGLFATALSSDFLCLEFSAELIFVSVRFTTVLSHV